MALAPAELRALCNQPFDLRGYQGLDAEQVENIWFIDRWALKDCGDRKQALQDFYERRDAALAGAR